MTPKISVARTSSALPLLAEHWAPSDLAEASSDLSEAFSDLPEAPSDLPETPNDLSEPPVTSKLP